ncbi:hypothetical protein D3C74_281820 [compost metagenome]
MRVNFHIILSVIFVVGWCFKYRIEIYDRNAEIGQVVQMVNDTLQIAAEEVAIFRFTSPFQRSFRIIGLIAIRKALGKNLIKHCVFRPLRRTLQVYRMQERKFEQSQVLLWHLLIITLFSKPELLLALCQNKAIR